jgi:hypothetical protein
MCGQIMQGVSSAFDAFTAFTGNQARASMAKANARATLQSGYANELSFRDEARAKIATQTNALGSRGVAISSGTPLQLLAESARNQEIDALQIRRNAQYKADQYKAEASAYSRAAWTSAAGAILHGASGELSKLGSLGGDMPVTGYSDYNVNGFSGKLPTFGDG